MSALAVGASVRGPDLIRWLGSAAVVLAAHAAVVLSLTWRSEQADVESGAPVVMLDLAPVAAAPPAPKSELPPGPLQTTAEAQEQVRQEAEAKPPDQPHEKYESPAMNPEVALPPRTPEAVREPAETKVAREAVEAAPAPTAPPSVEVPASRPQGPPVQAVSKSSAAAIITWQRAMLGRVQRFHRYPADAHNQSGIAEVEFAIDRAGRVLSSRLVKSSGHALLDRDAVALIKRASPFPSPPGDISDDLLTIVVPVRYDASTR